MVSSIVTLCNIGLSSITNNTFYSIVITTPSSGTRVNRDWWSKIQLPTHNSGSFEIPSIITHCSPSEISLVKYFNVSLSITNLTIRINKANYENGKQPNINKRIVIMMISCSKSRRLYSLMLPVQYFTDC